MRQSSFGRRQEILKLLMVQESVEVEDLAERFDVSKVTVRTDLDALAEKGLLIRTHGGALPAEKKAFLRNLTTTNHEHTEEKERIALKAVSLLSPGDSLILDSGSTTIHMVKHLSGKGLSVITGSIPAIEEIIEDPSIELVMLGGMIRRASMGAIGPVAEVCLDHIMADWYFMGAASASPKGDICTSNIVEAHTKNCMRKSAQRVCLLADSSKLKASSFAKVCSWDNIDILITDKISDEEKTAVEAHGVEVLLA